VFSGANGYPTPQSAAWRASTINLSYSRNAISSFSITNERGRFAVCSGVHVASSRSCSAMAVSAIHKRADPEDTMKIER
jgi:hypothetical protein